MARLSALALLALLAVAEVGVVLALYDRLGPLGTAGVLGLDMAIGLVVMRRAARGPVSDRGWRIAGGAFIALPGLVLDLVGIALLVPVTRRFVKRALRRNAESALRRSGMSVVTVTDAEGVERVSVVPGDVIQGEVLWEQDGPAPRQPNPESTAPPGGAGTKPQVIRGEILPREEDQP